MQRQLALITGTSSGIGAALAEQLCAQGWHVVGIARRPSPVTSDTYEHVLLDLADMAATQAYFAGPFLESHDLPTYQRIGLVNNAGQLAPVASLPRADGEELARSLIVNAAVPAWLMGFFARKAQGTPLVVVNISSGAATKAYPGWGGYCMGKAALRMAGQVMAVEADEVPALAQSALSVVAYAPGVADTPMQDEVRASAREEFPRLQKFLDLERDGKLVPPEKTAAEICRLLLRDDLPRFSEMRFGE